MTTANLPEFTWRKSSFSGNDTNCVEVGCARTHVGIRDTKQPDDGTLTLARATFDAFLRDVLAR